MPNIENEYDEAAKELCSSREHVMDFVQRMQFVVDNSMRPFLDNLHVLVDQLAGADVAEELQRSAEYKACEKVICGFERFLSNQHKAIGKRKLNDEIPYDHEVSLLYPQTIRGIAQMKAQTLLFGEIEQLMRRTHTEMTQELDMRSTKLPIRYRQYAKRGMAYSTQVDAGTATTGLLLRNFPGLKRYTV